MDMEKIRHSIGIVGVGFVGTALYHAFSSHFNVFLYDKYKDGFNTLEETVNNCDILFVCVPTPMKKNGDQDLSNLVDAISSISKISSFFKTIVIKSTVLPGTTRKLSQEFPEFHFVFNPEFLTERTAIFDFLNQSRIVLGIDKLYIDSSLEIEEIYRIRFPYTPIYRTSFENAELVKYVANCFFALKVSFFNEVYEACEKLGTSYEEVRGLLLGDQRIAHSHTEVPGPDGDLGFGGKCFPKDINALLNFFKKNKLPGDTLKAAVEVNKRVRKNKDWLEIKGATSKNNYGE